MMILTVSPGQPTSSSGDADFVTIEGRNNDLVRQINQKEIHWGVGSNNQYAQIGSCAFYE